MPVGSKPKTVGRMPPRGPAKTRILRGSSLARSPCRLNSTSPQRIGSRNRSWAWSCVPSPERGDTGRVADGRMVDLPATHVSPALPAESSYVRRRWCRSNLTASPWTRSGVAPPRRDAPRTLRHVMVRGLERRVIRREDTHRAEIVARLTPWPNRARSSSRPGACSRPMPISGSGPGRVPEYNSDRMPAAEAEANRRRKPTDGHTHG
jgi:hypothetical protein